MKDKVPSFWWSLPSKDILESLQVDPALGLSDAQTKDHGLKFGTNIFFEIKPRSVFSIVLESIQEPMMILLLAIAILSFIFGKIGGAIAMILEVVMYASLELINKFRTDRIMIQLKVLAHPTSKVMRNGTIVEINTQEIVVGDILILSEGVSVGADARLLISHGLIVNESFLTGESLPVDKDAAAVISEHVVLAERKNSIFSGTMVMNGEGLAVVVAVGERSELGKIATQVQIYKEERTLLQESMDQLAKILAVFAIVISAVIPAIGFMRGLELQEMILTWLALTFLMIPCQPPIIITMALSLAAFMLAQKMVVAKRLFGIEVLGQVSAVVSDKTGTITESKMKLDSFLTVAGEVHDLPGDIQEKIILALPDFCNHITDKTVVIALGDVKKNKHQVGFWGFSDQKQWRDLVYEDGETFLHVITGNPEMLIHQSTLSEEDKVKLIEHVREKAGLGCKLTAYAYIQSDQRELTNLKDLTFLSVAVMKDPVRPGVKNAIETLGHAGINTFVVTGDHAATAQAIALEVGIAGKVITGEELDMMNDQELLLQLGQSNIFSRMSPSQKLRLVTILKQKHIVAFIGDGINDAPALKAAHVGIAMGQNGTDLAKEVSDLILADDNYVHIPDAIEVGRKALDNFKKGLTYYLSAKCILLIIFIVPLFLGIPFPLVSIHIILVELLLDISSSTIFVAEEEEQDIMQRHPQKTMDFLGLPLLYSVLQKGIALAIGIVWLYVRTYQQYDLVTAQTVALVAWLLGHIFLALNLKQSQKPLITQGLLSNYLGLFWLFIMIMVAYLVTMIPSLHPYIQTTSLSRALWIQIVAVAFTATFWIEIKKLIMRRFFAQHEL